MATGPQCEAALSLVFGTHPETLKKTFGFLRLAGLTPTGGKGGGKSAVHFDSGHLAAVVACMSSQGPSGAVDAVRAFERLDWEKPVAGDISGLLNVIAGEIEMRAARIVQGQTPDDAKAAEWTITICLDPLTAWISWRENRKEVRRFFAEQQTDLLKSRHTERKGLRRLTVFDRHVFNTAAALCADSIQHKARLKVTAAPPGRGTTGSDQNRNPIPRPNTLDAKQNGARHQV